MAEVDIKTTGMHCQSCVRLITMTVSDLGGVESGNVDLQSGISHVVYDENEVGVGDIVKEIESAGYGATPLG